MFEVQKARVHEADESNQEGGQDECSKATLGIVSAKLLLARLSVAKLCVAKLLLAKLSVAKVLLAKPSLAKTPSG